MNSPYLQVHFFCVQHPLFEYAYYCFLFLPSSIQLASAFKPDRFLLQRGCQANVVAALEEGLLRNEFLLFYSSPHLNVPSPGISNTNSLQHYRPRKTGLQKKIYFR